MIESQRQRLAEHSSQYLSIGVTSDGEPRRSVSVPWERTANAYNMRIPSVYLSPADLADEAVWAALERFTITGCYIFCPLTDYGFLGRLRSLQDLHIRCGFFLPDLEALRSMEDLFQLYLEDAVIPTLAPLFPNGPRKGLLSLCLGLSGCTVADISALEQPGVRLSELVILEPEGTNQRSRWQHIRCGTYSYYEYRTPVT